MDKGYGILITSVTILVLCFVGTASAMNCSVDGSGGANFTVIQDAINNAKDGDTIIVHHGVYYENLVVDKSVILMGNGQPVVYAGGKEDAFTLTEDGITLVGFTATNAGSSRKYKGAGIWVISNNNTIIGNNARNNDYGIYLNYSSNNIITGNNVSNNKWHGIALRNSNNTTITGNTVSNNNMYDIRIFDSLNNTITGNVFLNDGLVVFRSYQNTVEDNTVNGKPLVYLEDVSDCKVEDAGQVILVNCNNITVENLVLSNTSIGVELLETGDSKVLNNAVSNNNGHGITLRNRNSNNNTITGNTVRNNNMYGIRIFDSCDNNILTGNNVRNNDDGIYLFDSRNNIIYLNNFINNNCNVHSEDSTNIWNSTEKITYTYNGRTYTNYLGNYRDDYEGTDADADGIGDTFFVRYQDREVYPLMKPFENYIITTSVPT